jgi:hypothetical protein
MSIEQVTGLMFIGVVVLAVLWYRILLKKSNVQRLDRIPYNYAICICGRHYIRGCNHSRGVVSTWVDVRTGLHYHPDGSPVEHR